MSTPQYFAGEPENMGRVARLPAATFAELVETFLAKPVSIPPSAWVNELVPNPEATLNVSSCLFRLLLFAVRF